MDKEHARWTRGRLAGRAGAVLPLTTLNAVVRVVGYAWLGLVAFVIFPPHKAAAAWVQAACYAIVGLAIVALTILDLRPATARSRGRWQPALLGLIAIAAGIASGTGDGASALIVFALVAAMMAAGEISFTSGVAVAAAGILAVAISGLVAGASIEVLLGFPLLVISGLVIGNNRGAYRLQAEQAAMLLAQREQLEAQYRRADLLDERARIAREIHDVLAHSLGALSIQIQAARAVLTDSSDVARADEILATAQRMAADGLVDTRRAVHALREDNLPLEAELARVSDAHAQFHRVATSFDTGGIAAPLPPDATVALLRVAQESLVNAAKHAAGQPVTVRLDYGDTDVRLTIRNELAGGFERLSPRHATTVAAENATTSDLSTVDGGYGLTGMRERLKLLNGTLQAGCRDNHWVVTAEVPRPEKARTVHETIAS
jgi:signal transduction histidine kinase